MCCSIRCQTAAPATLEARALKAHGKLIQNWLQEKCFMKYVLKEKYYFAQVTNERFLSFDNKNFVADIVK